MGETPLSQTTARGDSPVSQTEDASAWRCVRNELAEAGFRVVSFAPLTGDISARRYARLRLASGEHLVVCAYPDGMARSAARFLGATRLLDSVAVPTPRVEHVSLDDPTWILLEDVGRETLFDRWNRVRNGSGGGEFDLDGYLTQAIGWIRRIERLPVDAVASLGSPPLDRSLLAAELDLTWERFLEPQALVSDSGLDAALRSVCSAICERLGAAEAAPCHRDLMARNLMLCPRPPGSQAPSPLWRLVVIDHQDLRLGPPGYDLASLLNDSLRLALPERRRHLSTLELDADRLALYHAATAQRMLKIAGTFAYFATVRSDRYLELVPPALSRFLEALDVLPEGRELAPRLRRAWATVTSC